LAESEGGELNPGLGWAGLGWGRAFWRLDTMGFGTIWGIDFEGKSFISTQ
jgi:hypothetical protein